MIATPLQEIRELHLLNLIEQARAEDRTIEYKQHWPGKPENDDRASLVEAVASFANEIGGDLIVGMRAEKGIPVDVCGLETSDADATCRQIDQLIQAHTDPQCTAHTVQPVLLRSGRTAFVIRTDESWSRPHRVKLTNRFVGRGSAGKYVMDTAQIRNSFLRLLDVPARARALQKERFERIRSGDLPLKLSGGVIYALHLMPLRSFVEPVLLASRDLAAAAAGFPPLTGMGLSTRHNLDGIYNFRGDNPTPVLTQVFRTGVVETIQVFGQRNDQRKLLFPIESYELLTIEHLRGYLDALGTLGLSGPYYVFLSFLFPGGTVVARNYGEELTIDREIALVPEVEIASSDADLPQALRPAFDMVWNGWGRPASTNYTPNGTWIGGKRA